MNQIVNKIGDNMLSMTAPVISMGEFLKFKNMTSGKPVELPQNVVEDTSSCSTTQPSVDPDISYSNPVYDIKQLADGSKYIELKNFAHVNLILGSTDSAEEKLRRLNIVLKCTATDKGAVNQ